MESGIFKAGKKLKKQQFQKLMGNPFEQKGTKSSGEKPKASKKEEKEHGENKNEQTQSENKEASGKKEPAEKAAREEELKQAINKIDWAVSLNEKLKESLDGNLDEKISGIEQEVEVLKGKDYLSYEEKDRIMEKLDGKAQEKITSNISRKIKESELFEDRRALGIDVWNSKLEDSRLPFAFSYGTKKDFAETDPHSGGARFDAGRIIVNPEMPSSKMRLRNWVDGYDSDLLLSHEALHGFQTADIQLCREFAEIELGYKSIDDTKLTHEDGDNYRKKKKDLERRWAEKLGIEPNKIENAVNGKNPNDTAEDYNARWALREVHSYWARINHEGVKNREQSIEETVAGGYKLPIQAIKKGIELMRQMKALKIDDKTIGKFIFLTKIDLSSKEIFVDLFKFVNDFKNSNGISEEAMQKLAKLADLEETKELLILKSVANQEIADYYSENRNIRDTIKDLFRKRFKK